MLALPFLISVASAQLAAAAFDCHLSLGKEQFDLSSLGGVHTFDVSTPTPPSITKTVYTLSLCSPLPAPSTSAPEDTCPEGTHICMTTLTTRSGLEDRVISVVPIAAAGALNPTARLRDGEKDAGNRWVLGMEGGVYNGVPQVASVEMVCGEAKTETAPTFVDYDPKGVLSLKWVTGAACSTTSSNPPPPPTPDKPSDTPKHGSSFFGWFFTLFFLSMLAYFAGGAYYNYSQYGATGWDMVPHRDLWRDLPYVIADLFKGRGGSRSGYSALG